MSFQDNLSAGRGGSRGQFRKFGLPGRMEMGFRVLDHNEIVVLDRQQSNNHRQPVTQTEPHIH